jgi:cystathionine beta-lyase
MKNNFDTPINRRNSDSIKWTLYEEDVLPLWVADMDFVSPRPVLDAIRDRLDHGLFGYSRPQESTKLTICKWLERRHNWIISPEDVLLYPGVVPAFNLVSRAFTNPGDSILIQTPAYHPFLDLPQNANVIAVEQSLQVGPSGIYEIDHPVFRERILPTTRIFMLCNPHNPTGRVFRKDELITMAETCLEHNVLICSDEIHSDLVYPPNCHIPIASISNDIAQSTITLISPSKTFNIAGLKASAVIITNDRLRETFIKRSSGVAGSVNILGEVAMHAAYSFCDDWLEELLVYLEHNRQMLFDFVTNELPGVSMILPQGTYLGWLDFTGTNLESPCSFILDKARVGINSGEWFGSGYTKFARINFGCQLSTLLAALERIKSALSSTQAPS